MQCIATAPLLDLDLLLQEPRRVEFAEIAYYDLETGRLNPPVLGPRNRSVYIRKDRIAPPVDEDTASDADETSLGQSPPCAVSAETAPFGRTSVLDHQTTCDQPVPALRPRPTHVQPPCPIPATACAPLRPRHAPLFSTPP